MKLTALILAFTSTLVAREFDIRQYGAIHESRDVLLDALRCTPAPGSGVPPVVLFRKVEGGQVVNSGEIHAPEQGQDDQ